MPKFLILLLASLLCNFPAISYATDDEEIAQVSVRLYHQICMAKIFDQKEEMKILEHFPLLPEDKAAVFKEMLGAGAGSEVWAINFPKANFIAIYDAGRKACHLITLKPIPQLLIEREFDEHIAGLKKDTDVTINKLPPEQNDDKWTISIGYVFSTKDLQLMNIISTRRNFKEDGIGSIYTMVLKGTQ